MKLWFVEPKANVFVSGIKDSTAEKVVKYLLEHCPPSSGVIIFQRIPEAPGYKITTIGKTDKEIIKLSGLQLVFENHIQ
jgi:CRISPR-associated protein Cas2